MWLYLFEINLVQLVTKIIKAGISWFHRSNIKVVPGCTEDTMATMFKRTFNITFRKYFSSTIYMVLSLQNYIKSITFT